MWKWASRALIARAAWNWWRARHIRAENAAYFLDSKSERELLSSSNKGLVLDGAEEMCIRDSLKTDAREQALKTRTHEPSRKETLKARLHSLFERASTFKELAELSKAEGFNFYQRGKTVGVAVRDPDGQERKHRLSTLGVEAHYEMTNRRLAEPAKKPERVRQEPPKAAPAAERAHRPEPERVRMPERQQEPAKPERPEPTALAVSYTHLDVYKRQYVGQPQPQPIL